MDLVPVGRHHFLQFFSPIGQFLSKTKSTIHTHTHTHTLKKSLEEKRPDSLCPLKWSFPQPVIKTSSIPSKTVLFSDNFLLKRCPLNMSLPVPWKPSFPCLYLELLPYSCSIAYTIFKNSLWQGVFWQDCVFCGCMWDNIDETGVSEHFMKHGVSVRHSGTVWKADVTGIMVIPGGKNISMKKFWKTTMGVF